MQCRCIRLLTVKSSRLLEARPTVNNIISVRGLQTLRPHRTAFSRHWIGSLIDLVSTRAKSPTRCVPRCIYEDTPPAYCNQPCTDKGYARAVTLAAGHRWKGTSKLRGVALCKLRSAGGGYQIQGPALGHQASCACLDIPSGRSSITPTI